MKIVEVHLVHEPTLFEVPVNALREPKDIYDYMKDVMQSHPDKEVFYTILMNTRRKPIGRHLVTVGTATSSLAHPREVFRAAIIGNATCIAVCHSHPSGDPEPSSADIAITRQLREAAKVLGIELVDHVIIGDPAQDPIGRGYFSFRMAGLM